MNRIPKTMAVVGGGVIGSEYASVFTVLGAQVTLVDTRDRLLPFVDAEIADRLQQQLKSLGLRFIFNEQLLSAEVQAEHVHLQLKGGEQLEADIVLVAAGRQSNVQGLGLETIGVQLGKRGLIVVNEHYQTSVPNIYAAGDVIGFPALASTSMDQARVAMVHAFNLRYKERVSPILPLAVYTIPEISMVGLSEDECQMKNVPYLVGRARYQTNPRGQIIGDLSGLIKLVFSPPDGQLLGVHIIGEMASELIHIGAQVMAAQGTIDAFIQAVYNYPTLSDAYKYAAYDGLGAQDRWRAAQSLQGASG
jgi:NAD(P) transhydrogenase